MLIVIWVVMLLIPVLSYDLGNAKSSCTLIRRFPTPISEFLELHSIFLPKNPPSTPITLPLLTFQSRQILLNFPTRWIQQLLTQRTFISLYRSQLIPQPHQSSP